MQDFGTEKGVGGVYSKVGLKLHSEFYGTRQYLHIKGTIHVLVRIEHIFGVLFSDVSIFANTHVQMLLDTNLFMQNDFIIHKRLSS